MVSSVRNKQFGSPVQETSDNQSIQPLVIIANHVKHLEFCRGYQI